MRANSAVLVRDAYADPHRALQLGAVGCVSHDVIVRRRDPQEVQVVGSLGAGQGLLWVVGVQHPEVILTQERILYTYTHTSTQGNTTSVLAQSSVLQGSWFSMRKTTGAIERESRISTTN